MSRIVTIICFLLACLPKAFPGAKAESEMDSGWNLIDTMPGQVGYACLHARLEPEKGKKTDCALAWNWQDSLNYNYVLAQVDARGDDVYGNTARVVAGSKRNGVDDASAALSVAFSKQLSLKVIYDGFAAKAYVGEIYGESIGNVSFDPQGGGCAMLGLDRPTKSIAMRTDFEEMASLGMSEWQCADSLMAQVASSSDPYEGIWEHLDRDIREGSAQLGGKYVLATVRNGDNGYDIVYLSGATANSQCWQPLRVKGRLSPTIFDGNMDLVWLDSYGRLLNDDCYGQISPDNAILTLSFPVHHAQLRMRRKENLRH